jgi:hypothetical protein
MITVSATVPSEPIPPERNSPRPRRLMVHHVKGHFMARRIR